MRRIFRHPELLFMALVILLPFSAAFFWSGAFGFWMRLLLTATAGLVVWLIIVVVVIRPQYRDY